MDAITAIARAIAGGGPKRFGRFARSVLRRYAQHQIHQWLDNLWEHPDTGPVFADWLEENNIPTGPHTLAELRSPGQKYAGLVRGVVHATERTGTTGPQGQVTGRYLDPLTRSYLNTALWSSTHDDGRPLDHTHNIYDISQRTVNHANLMADVFRRGLPDHLGHVVDLDPDAAGRDLWLTQNGHGAGFWDGGWDHLNDESMPDEGVGRDLTEHAQKLPETSLYLGDDGEIHHHSG